MKTLKPKIALFILFAISILFFSNDFGLIDIEKTAIITAIAIDKSQDGEYEVTCQIAVPEASNAISENQKAQLSGKGSTVAHAIKEVGSVSGWFPQTIFCNLIILGNDLLEENVMNVIDYFSGTMRVQGSAQIVFAEKKAKELLEATTPLDNISSFAIQKILLKNPGFDQDVSPIDVKTFCVDYYSESTSSFIPLVKIITTEKEQSDSQSSQPNSQDTSGNKTKGKNTFDATTTSLFLRGKKVGELDRTLTRTLNTLTKNVNGTSFNVDDVNGENFLIGILYENCDIKLNATNNDLNLKIKVDMYCKVLDNNECAHLNNSVSSNALPLRVKQATELQIKNAVTELIETSRQTGCDFLHLKEKLYRFCNKQYSRYKDNYLQVLNYDVQVNVNGQR